MVRLKGLHPLLDKHSEQNGTGYLVVGEEDADAAFIKAIEINGFVGNGHPC